MAQHLRSLTLDETQLRLDYSTRTDGQPVYLGKAPMGTKDSDGHWTIYYHEYNANNQLTTRTLVEKGVWDDRASLSYS